MIGQLISHYKILEKLGEGGMGVVYKAEDTKLKRTVALKFLSPELTRDPDAKERFVHEAQSASALEHANICSIHEVGEHDGQIFIVMGYYVGETLNKKIEGGSLPISESIKIIHQVAQGLSKAHEAGIIHRDIKPANIIVTTDGVAKILDFGLAKVTGRTLLTKSGMTLGTAAYMSPEQARGESVDKRTDIWSLGITFYETLTGKRPFQSEYEQALVYSILNEEPKSIRELMPDVPEAIEKICRRAMAKNANDRYQTAAELITDLDSYQAGTKLLQKTQNVLNKKRIFIYAWLVLILVVLALIFNPFNLRIGIQQNAAAPKPSLAIIGFENVPDPADTSYTGEMLTNYLITALFDAKDLDVVSRERLFSIQNQLGHGESKKIPSTVAEEIARHAGASTMLLASILQVEPNLIITYRVVNILSGKIVNTRRLEGYPKDKIISLVDTLAVMVRSDLNIASQASAPAKSVMDVTTTSPEAYRSYVEGMVWLRKWSSEEAIIAFKKAVELDSNFAMAHYYLGLWGGEQAETRKAWELRTRVTEKEKLQIEALYANVIEGNPGKSAEISEQLLYKYPHEQLVWLQWVLYLGALNDYDHQPELIERGLRCDSMDAALWNMRGYILAGYNKRNEALYSMDKYIQLAPKELNSYDGKGDVFLALGEPDSAMTWWRRGLALSILKVGYQTLLRHEYSEAIKYFQKVESTTDGALKALAERQAVLVYIHRGELIKAKSRLKEYLELHRRNKADQVLVGDDLLYLILIANEEGNYIEMLRYARERSEQIRKHGPSGFNNIEDIFLDPSNRIYGQYEIVWALVRNGRREESSRLLTDLKMEQRPELPRRQAAYDYFLALCAFERGEFNVAVDHFSKSLNKFTPNRAPQYHYAVSLLKSERVNDAIAEFQRMTWWSGIGDGGPITPGFSPMVNYWPIAAVKAHYWLGVAYEQQGKKNEAIKEYETLLDIWKNADFKSPEMQDARVRLVRLKRGSVK